MTPRPWLTIVTVIKDDVAGLERTIDSLARIDLQGVEYLIIDSSRDELAAPEQLKASGIQGRVIRVRPQGVYPAMNRGLSEATGSFIYFLNAGDEILENGFVALRARLSLGDAAWLRAPVEIVVADGDIVITPEWDFDVEKAHDFSRGKFAAHQGTVVRTEFLQGIGGLDESFRIAGDYATFLRLASTSIPVELFQPLARFHEGGLSTRHWARSHLEFRRARRLVLGPAHSALASDFLAMDRLIREAIYRSPWPLVLTLCLGAWAFMLVTGVSAGTAAGLTGIVALQSLGGAIWWRLLQPRRPVPIIEAVGVGIGLGTAAATLAGLLGAWWLPSAVAALAWLGALGRGQRFAVLGPLRKPDLLALILATVPGFGALTLALRSYPLGWSGVLSTYHGDMPFFEALSASVATLGPGSSIFLPGADLRYHLLVYGWAGDLTLATDSAPFVVLTRLLPVVALLGLITVAIAWTRQLTAARWAPTLAAVLMVTGGFVGAQFGGIVNFDSPSQTLSTLWLLVLSVMLLQGLRAPTMWPYLVASGTLMVAITGGKISSGVVALGAFGMVTIVGLFSRQQWSKRALAFFATLLVSGGGTYLWLMAGSANAGGLGLFSLLDRASSVQQLNPVHTTLGVAVGTAVLILATLPRWSGVLWFATEKQMRVTPESAYSLGLVSTGVLSLAALSGGFNDLWFAVAASAPLTVLSVVGLALAVTWLGPGQRSRLLLACLAALLSSLIVASLWASGSSGTLGTGWRWSGSFVALALAAVIALSVGRGVSSPVPRSKVYLTFMIVVLVVMSLPSRAIYAIADQRAQSFPGGTPSTLFTPQVDFIEIIDKTRETGWPGELAVAAQWLRANSGARDLIATNLSRSAIVPALTRLPTLATALPLQTAYGRASDVTLAVENEKAAWAFIDRPGLSTLTPLCEARVRWLWIDPRRTSTRNWAPYASIVWQDPNVIIGEVDTSLCSAL